MFDGQSKSYNSTHSSSSNASKTIREENFPSNHLMRVQLVHQRRGKSYKPDFFFFLSAVPSGKAGEGGKTYITSEHITFKLEILQLVALGKAFQYYGLGSGLNIAPEYTIWADPSKCEQAVGDAAATRNKHMKVSSRQHNRDANQRAIVCSVNRGTGQGQGAKSNYASFQITFSPFEALAIADTLFDLVAHARKLLLEGGVEDSNPHPKGGTTPPVSGQMTEGRSNNQQSPKQPPHRDASQAQAHQQSEAELEYFDPYAAESAKYERTRQRGDAAQSRRYRVA